MAIQGNDIISLVTGGALETLTGGSAPASPNAPAIVVSADLNSLTVTIDGDPGVTHYVIYKLAAAVGWTAGGSRVGDGNVVITGLAIGTYQVIAYSIGVGGGVSTPGNQVTTAIAALSVPSVSVNILRNGLNFLNAQLQTHAGEVVTYSRGAVQFSLTAVVGKTEYSIVSEDGFEVESSVTDFLISRDAMVKDSVQYEPEQGDVIETTDFGSYEVMFLSGAGCWKYSDPFGTLYRIHTKRIN